MKNIWGIGKQTSNWLQSKGIKNAKELRDMDQDEIIKKLGVVGKRLQLELKGNKCLPVSYTHLTLPTIPNFLMTSS